MLGRRPPIAVVELQGVIGTSIRPAEYGRLFRGLREDSHVKAVILEVDSPGGSAVASDYLYLTLRRLAEAKPVIAFVRGMAASGGYFLACAANRIIAVPSAVTGSIGVISIRPILVDLMEKAGVRVAVSKTGPLKDMGAPYKEASTEEMRKEEELVGQFFDRFVEVVATERGLPNERVREYATGEVYIGQRAQELGLVDEMGDFERALDLASEMANVPPKFSVARPRRPILQRIMAPVGQALAEQVVWQAESRLQRRILYQAPRRRGS